MGTDQIFAREVKRLDGMIMTDWKNYDFKRWRARTTKEILAIGNGDGICNAWASLFRDVLSIQGIDASRLKVTPRSADSYLLVKMWRTVGMGHPQSEYPFTDGVDLIELNKMPAQGNDKSPGRFNLHYIVESGGNHYDPSYGSIAIKGGELGKSFEDQCFFGYGRTEFVPLLGGGVRLRARKNSRMFSYWSEVDYNVSN